MPFSRLELLSGGGRPPPARCRSTGCETRALPRFGSHPQRTGSPPAPLSGQPASIEEIWLDAPMPRPCGRRPVGALVSCFTARRGGFGSRATRTGSAPRRCPIVFAARLRSPAPARPCAMDRTAAAVRATARSSSARKHWFDRDTAATWPASVIPHGTTASLRLIGAGMMGQEHIRNSPCGRRAGGGDPRPAPGMSAAAQALAPRRAPGGDGSRRCWTWPRSTPWSSPSPNHCPSISGADRGPPAPCPSWSRKAGSFHGGGEGGPDRRAGPSIRPGPGSRWDIRYPCSRSRNFLARADAAHGRRPDAEDPGTPLLPSSTRSAAGTGSTASPAAPWWKNAAISST